MRNTLKFTECSNKSGEETVGLLTVTKKNMLFLIVSVELKFTVQWNKYTILVHKWKYKNRGQ